jgi:hypothetical protein
MKTESNPIFVKPINPVFMKRRVRKIANFFAFNLLFFALYLNFIHKDKMPAAGDQNAQQSTAAFSGTVLVDNPEQYLEKKAEVSVIAPKTNESNTAALKLSIN